MKFLKVFVNSLITGFFFSALLVLLIYDININLNVQALFFGHLTLFLLITYGLAVTVLSVIFFFILQFILGSSFKITFISPSFLTLSFSLTIALFLLIFKANYDYFFSFFSEETQSLLNKQFLTFIFLVVLGLVCFYSVRLYKRSFIFLLVYYIAFFAGMYYVVLQRLNYPLPQKSERVAYLEAKELNKKVTIIGLDGLSFDVMIPLINEEKLPNFAWLMEEGSWGRLENFAPTEPVIHRTSFGSGKLPSKHRQLSLFRYNVLKSKQEFEVSPRFIFFGQLLRTNLLKRYLTDPPFHSKDIWTIFKDNNTSHYVKDWPYYRRTPDPTPKAETRFNLIFEDLKSDDSFLFSRVRRAFFSDFEYEDQVMQFKTETQPQIVYFLLNGLNDVERFFYKYTFPDLFGNIEQDEINRYSSVIERYYQFYDDIIGKYLASRKEDELLVVYSPHGIEPLPLWGRVREWMLGSAEISAYHELAPDGVVFFYGREIWRGRNVEQMRLIDFAPTLLNFLGLPIGKDMDGIVCSSFFRDEFKLENPVLYISSYEEHTIKQPD
ncbi:MAG: alkaline phosphatase family protein [Candidatus Aminicenantes bacterium]|nr:MAG: alkaline phosphatase family protein [Candidatus Aminicenantes bacterium]